MDNASASFAPPLVRRVKTIVTLMLTHIPIALFASGWPFQSSAGEKWHYSAVCRRRLPPDLRYWCRNAKLCITTR
ncbi:hypothetical protein KCP78_14425 [Salmonella enterica subsp. enterica]|nr:hypothetical protein KCP78_14425 [Salmonella enterica subsp. enterica]